MKIQALSLLVLLLGANAAIAAGSCNSISCTGKVMRIFTNGGNGKIYLKSEADMTQLNCTLDQGKYIVLKESNLRHKEIYSMLLSAQMAQKDVIMRIVENSQDCELIYTVIDL